MTPELTKNIVEVALFAAGRPLSIDNLLALFDEKSVRPERGAIRAALDAIQEECTEKGLELREVASGFRFQIKQEYAEWIGRLWAERPTRYSRALLETLALIAYRQPITRAEIEDIRGVGMSSSIMKTLQEKFGSDPRFHLVSFSLDGGYDTPETLTDFTKTHGIGGEN